MQFVLAPNLKSNDERYIRKNNCFLKKSFNKIKLTQKNKTMLVVLEVAVLLAVLIVPVSYQAKKAVK